MTTSVLPPLTLASEAQTTSAAPRPVGAVKDFAEALSRRLKRTDDTPDADAASVPLLDANAAGCSASAHAALEPAALSAQIATQASHAVQGAARKTDAAADIAPFQAQSSARLDAGRTPRFALRTTHAAAMADVNTESAAPALDDVDRIGNASTHTAKHQTANKTHATATSLATPSTAAHAQVLHTANTAAGIDTPQAKAQDVPTHAMDSLASGATNHDGSSPAHQLLTLTQPMPLHNASAPSGVPTLGASAIAAPLHHPQWSEALSQHVLHLTQASAQGPQVAELRLDPPELGPLRIAIELHQHVAHASFVSAHASVRLAVENALPQLQEQLAQAGISLGQTNVSDQGFSQQESPAHDAMPFTLSRPAPQTAHTPAAAVRNTHALIDTFA